MRLRGITTAHAFLATAAAAAAASPEICNGRPELCDRRYTNITFVGAHNSPFVGDFLADNQNIPISEQLAMGVRFLQGQTHNDNGAIQLCHTDCLLRDAGPLGATMLAPVKAFLDANPTEVVTLLLTNPDGFSGTAFGEVFRDAGLESYAFSGNSTATLEQWPTLGEMIASGQRLVVFMDYPKSPSVPYILDEFGSFIVETPFQYDEVTELSSCPIDRPAGATVENRMLLMNHWLQINIAGILIPDRNQAPTTNSVESLTIHAQSCQVSLRRVPNFILLDWIDVGDAMLLQDTLNGLQPAQDAVTGSGTPTKGRRDDLVGPPSRKRRARLASQ